MLSINRELHYLFSPSTILADCSKDSPGRIVIRLNSMETGAKLMMEKVAILIAFTVSNKPNMIGDTTTDLSSGNLNRHLSKLIFSFLLFKNMHISFFIYRSEKYYVECKHKELDNSLES